MEVKYRKEWKEEKKDENDKEEDDEDDDIDNQWIVKSLIKLKQQHQVVHSALIMKSFCDNFLSLNENNDIEMRSESPSKSVSPLKLTGSPKSYAVGPLSLFHCFCLYIYIIFFVQ